MNIQVIAEGDIVGQDEGGFYISDGYVSDWVGEQMGLTKEVDGIPVYSERSVNWMLKRLEVLTDVITPNGYHWDELMQALEIQRELTIRGLIS